MWKLALAVVVLASAAPQSPQQAGSCAPGDRRAAAIRFAREINTGEAAAYRLQRSYQQLEQLPIGTLPNDYTVQLSTDGVTYAFSIKDKTDACHGVVFSDQGGLIYTGVPI